MRIIRGPNRVAVSFPVWIQFLIVFWWQPYLAARLDTVPHSSPRVSNLGIVWLQVSPAFDVSLLIRKSFPLVRIKVFVRPLVVAGGLNLIRIVIIWYL